MQPTLCAVLSNIHSHPRDKDIQFFEEGHKYVILTDVETKYTSVTAWNHSHFAQFDANAVIINMMKSRGWKVGHKYWGLTPEQIKAQWDSNKDAVAGAGTALHFEIECFNNNPRLSAGYTNKELYDNYINSCLDHESKPIEWKYFINFIRDTPHLKPFRTEWTIYDEDLKIAGSIDILYENTDGTLSIYDWKRAANITRINNFNKFAITPEVCHFPDSNFWHYALQLNTYKTIIERKYNRIIQGMFLVRLHPDATEQNYELISIPNLLVEINDLFAKRLTSI